MLRPYLTVIRDSFRAAMNSRVLYIVLALILLVLLALAPFHVRQTLDWRLSFEDGFPAPDRLVARLVEEGKSRQRPTVAHIWDQLTPELQSDLEKQAGREAAEERRPGDGPGGTPAERRLLAEFNELMESSNLYDEQAFAGKRLSEETRDLLDKGDRRSVDEDRRLNRLLLSTALRRDVAQPGETQLDFYYFNWHWKAFTTNVSHSEFASGITSQLPTYFDKFIMSIGIFIAILITASIIPEMLEAGSLNLLLSKPVHRWGLLLAKYVGGCVFIFLCASLLFVGLWLWMGIQLGIWERAILLSIPTYVFVFAMYYAVSVLAGIWFRSPILCITFAILFWAVCSAIGYAYAWLDYRHYNAAAHELIALQDDVMMVDMLQQHLAWDRSEDAWRSPAKRDITPEEGGFVFASFLDRLDEFPDMPGPTVAQQPQRFLFVNNGLVDALSNSRLRLASANAREDWKVADRGALPPSTVQVLNSPRLGQLVVDQTGAVFAWQGTESSDDPATDQQDSSNEPASDSTTNKLQEQLSGLFKGAKRDSEYQELSEESSFQLRSPSAVSLNPQNDEIVYYSGGQLVVLSVNEEGRYSVRQQQKIGDHENVSMTAMVVAAGKNIFVMLGNGRFYHLDASDLSILHSEDLSDRAAIRCLSARRDGSLAALTLRSGELWIYDANTQAQYDGFGINAHDILACQFDEQGRLWVGDRFQAAYCYDLQTGNAVLSYEPNNGWLTRGFRLVVRPLYRIFPKPGEFYKLVSHLSSSGDARGNPDIDMTKLPYRDNPWSPLKSGVLFTLLVLGIACFTFQRQDF